MSTNSKRARDARRAADDEKLGDAVEATLRKEKIDEEGGDELSPEERAALGESPDEDENPDQNGALTAATDSTSPEWAIIPDGLKFPKGKVVHFLRIPAEWTDTPNDGDRQCIMWNLNMADEDLALKRSRGEQSRVNRELSMVMVRAIDGHIADWTSGKVSTAGNVRKWFNDIGARGRLLVQNVYLRTHTVDAEMKRRFFVDCFASMTST